MKIAIIGGGVAGLSTYLHLQKQLLDYPQLGESIEITIYETHNLRKQEAHGQKHDIPSSGGGYGVAANGMASLRRLDPVIHDHVLRNGFPSPRMQMMSARGYALGCISNVDDRGEHPENCCMVLREVVIDGLSQRVPSSAIALRKVIAVIDGEDEVAIRLDNGEEARFDLVVGADGVWSKARQAVLGDKQVAEYRGLFSVGGFVSTDHLPKPPANGQMPPSQSQTVMVMGPNGFFGYTPCTTGDVEATPAHIRGDLALPPGKLAFWWSRSAQENPQANPDEDVMQDDLMTRLKFWKDPTIHKILQNSKIVLKTPTWTLPKIPTWAGNRVVLVGDAAHGVSQAMEDAEALSMLLTHNLSSLRSEEWSKESQRVAITKSFDQYMTVRKAHVEKILDIGNRAGDASRDLGLFAEYATYFFMRIMLQFFGSFLFKPILRYDVLSEVRKVM